MDILDVKTQSLSVILADFFICENCRIIDRDWERSRKGYLCPHCKSPSNAGRAYLPITALSLINLMQEYYHLKSDSNNVKDHKLAIIFSVLLVRFYCTTF